MFRSLNFNFNSKTTGFLNLSSDLKVLKKSQHTNRVPNNYCTTKLFHRNVNYFFNRIRN